MAHKDILIVLLYNQDGLYPRQMLEQDSIVSYFQLKLTQLYHEQATMLTPETIQARILDFLIIGGAKMRSQMFFGLLF